MRSGRWSYVLISILLLVLWSCGGEVEQSRASEDGVNHQDNQEETMQKAAEETMTAGSDNSAPINPEKWNSKAKQALELMNDYILILQDSTLDPVFKKEINTELAKIFPLTDTANFQYNQDNVEFRKFKKLKLTEGDTLTLDFKNKKEKLTAYYLVSYEVKNFGDSEEAFEKLNLIAIKHRE